MKNYQLTNITNEKLEIMIKELPFSDTSISRSVTDLYQDAHDQVISGLKQSAPGHCIQLDESTDVENKAQLIAYVR